MRCNDCRHYPSSVAVARVSPLSLHLHYTLYALFFCTFSPGVGPRRNHIPGRTPGYVQLVDRYHTTQAHELVLYRAMSTHYVLISCPGIGPSPTLTIPKGYHISPNLSTGCHILGLWFHPQAISVAHIHWTGPRGSVRCRCLHPHRPAPREAQCQSNGLRPADGGTAAGCVCV